MLQKSQSVQRALNSTFKSSSSSTIVSRGPFLETSATFRAHCGCYNFLRILRTKMFPGMKFCNKFALSYLEIIVKDQLLRISGS